METVELQTPRAVSQNKSYGLVELFCELVKMNTNIFKPTYYTMNHYSWRSERSQEKFAPGN